MCVHRQIQIIIHTQERSTQPTDLGDVKLLAEAGVNDVLGGAAKGVAVGRPQHYNELVAEVLERAYARAAACIEYIPDGQRGPNARLLSYSAGLNDIGVGGLLPRLYERSCYAAELHRS